VNLQAEPESDGVICWRDLFTSILTQEQPAEAVGAFGLGTEHIVSPIYQHIIRALAYTPELSARDTCFFVLHIAVDDHHKEALEHIACDYAVTEEGRIALRRGMLKALNLRSCFWDGMLIRAQNPQAYRTSGTQ
jgi:pyrroloquinoline quinone (PQQ) biosynthesis protein C